MNGAGLSRMHFEAFETFPHLPRLDAKTSCWNRLRLKFATTCQNLFGRFEYSVSSQLLVNPERGQSSYQSPLIGIDNYLSVYNTSIGICSQIWDRWGDEQEIYRIPLFWSSRNQISHASWSTFYWRRAKFQQLHQFLLSSNLDSVAKVGTKFSKSLWTVWKVASNRNNSIIKF
jgi:hypothetical protein